jgi:magnesium-protoporphyrin O-methyltransferase
VEPERQDEPRCCFDDWVGHWEDRTEKHPTAAKVTEDLLAALEEAGVRGRTVLDLGCGIGDVAIETVRRGATRADGFDLSTKAIEEARKLAGARGVADRTSFTVGDGATVELPTRDVVILNRVFCCYPNVEQLLERSLASAGAVYAFTMPPSGGFAGRLARAMTWCSNRYYAMRERKFAGFRVFIHDVDRIEARVRAAGFRPVRRERVRLSWELAVYAR